MIINKIKLSVQKIISLDDLVNVIQFLENGYRWSQILSRELITFILESNQELGFYGYKLVSNSGKICGAILTIHQGYYISESKIPVLNISSWYVSPDHRGIASIQLISELIRNEKDSIITNYSVGTKFLKIMTSLGFKSMKLKRFTTNFVETLIYSKQGNTILKKIDYNKLLDRVSNFRYIKNGFNSLAHEVNINGDIFQIIGSLLIVQRSIFGIKFKTREFRIIWSSNNSLLSKNWYKVCFLIVKNLLVLRIHYDFNKSDLPNQSKTKESKYILLAPDYIDLIYVPPISSELSISKILS